MHAYKRLASLIALPFDELQNLRSLGETKLKRLVLLIERAVRSILIDEGLEPTPLSTVRLDAADKPGTAASAELRFDSARRRFAAVSEHRLASMTLDALRTSLDRHLPSELLGLTLTELLQSKSYAEIADTPGVGPTRLERLLTVVERSLDRMEAKTSSEVSDPHPRGASEVTSPAFVSDKELNAELTELDEWLACCDAIRRHHLDHLPLGRFAKSLNDISGTLWTEPLSELMPATISELGRRDSERVRQVVPIIARLGRLLLRLQISDVWVVPMPQRLREAATWCDAAIARDSTIDREEFMKAFLHPLLEQLQLDVSDDVISMIEYRIGLNGNPETLEQIASRSGVTRERVRQKTQRASTALTVRWPAGPEVLRKLAYKLLQQAHSDALSRFCSRICDQLFEVKLDSEEGRDDVLAAWAKAGERKQTPMLADEIAHWAGKTFFGLAPSSCAAWVRSVARRVECERGELWFSNTELDQLLADLYERAEPCELNERTRRDVADEPEGRLSPSGANELRSLRVRVQHDPRFVQLDDGRFLPADRCGFGRLGGVWFAALEPVFANRPLGSDVIAVRSLAEMIVAGLLRLGVVDATAWGVHRFANELVRDVYGARLPSSVTPFVLADMLVLVSEPLMQPMKRRRLRWGSQSNGHKVLGKRGWVSRVVEEVGHPIVIRELDPLLRRYYQDYADYVVKQIYSAMDDEEGSTEVRVEFVTQLGHSIPVLIVPHGWQLHESRDNVSEGVLQTARRLARQLHDPSVGRDRRLRLEELDTAPWLRELVKRLSLSASADSFDDDDSEGDDDSSRALLVAKRLAPAQSATDSLKSLSEVVALHQSDDPYRAFDADLMHSSERLLTYAFWRICTLMPEWRPWSIAELALVEDDYRWLSSLMSALRAGCVRRFLSGTNLFPEVSLIAQLGAVFLTFDSELARRFAISGNLWASVIRHLPQSVELKSLLFMGERPTALHRRALEAATSELGLRNAFGDDSAQEWYQLLYLQFGFSRPTFERQLPEWLQGHSRLVSMDRLLDDQQLASPSFRELWDALRDYRTGHIKRDELKLKLTESPWVLDEWHESLIALCRADSVPAVATEAVQSKVSSDVEVATSGDKDITFLSAPTLQRFEHGVRFSCRVEVCDATELSDEICNIQINGKTVSQLIRQADGRYDATVPQVWLADSASRIFAELRTLAGDVIATQELVLWDAMEDVDGYAESTGRRLNPYSREFAERDGLLIFASDLTLEPARELVAVIGGGRRHVVALTARECRESTLLLDGEVLWEPVVREWPEWRELVDVEIEYRTVIAPNSFRLKVTHPVDVEPTSWRSRRLKISEWKRDGAGTHVSEWLPLDAERKAEGTMHVTVQLRSNDVRTSLRRRLPLNLAGNLWRREGYWDFVPATRIVSVADVKETLFRLAPPEHSKEQWHVFEGQHWVCSIETPTPGKQRPTQRIYELIGRGAPLRLRSGPYNSTEPEQPILGGAVDHGVIADVKESDEHAVTISFNSRIEPDSGHCVVLLHHDGAVREVGALSEKLRCVDDGSSSQWVLQCSDEDSFADVVALAVAYGRSWLGSWWREDWVSIFEIEPSVDSGANVQRAAQIADAVRWFRLPVLERQVRSEVAKFAHQFAVSVIPVWLSDTSPHDFEHSDRREWETVLRSLLHDWAPTSNEAIEVDRRLAEMAAQAGALPFEVAMSQFVAVDGLLAARVIRAGLDDATYGTNRRQTVALLDVLKQRTLQSRSAEQLLQSVVTSFESSDRRAKKTEGTDIFIRDALLANVPRLLAGDLDVEDFNRRNIEIAMRLDSFRRLVLLTCLDALRQG